MCHDEAVETEPPVPMPEQEEPGLTSFYGPKEETQALKQFPEKGRDGNESSD